MTRTWCGSTWYSSTFLEYSYSYNLWVMYSYSYSMYSDFTSTLQVHLSTFSIYAVKIYLSVVDKMKLSSSI